MADNIVTVDDLHFEAEVLKSEKPVLVSFTAVWCGPCKQVAPIVEGFAKETAGQIKVVKVDIDKAPATATKLGIRGVPTLIVYKGGQELRRHSGSGVTNAKLKAMFRE